MAMIVVNLFCYFRLLPYAQKTANSHMNTGPFFGTILYLITGILLVFVYKGLFRQSDNKFFISLLVFASTLFFWACKLYFLMCLPCVNGG